MQETKTGAAADAPSVLKSTAMVFGQMNEPPGARLRVALSALTMPSGSATPPAPRPCCSWTTCSGSAKPARRCPALLGRMPSAVGYQPTLSTEMGELQERITSTTKGAITSVQAVYVPADDPTDPGPGQHLPAPRRLHLPGAVDQREGHLPGRGPAGVQQPLLDPGIVGESTSASPTG